MSFTCKCRINCFCAGRVFRFMMVIGIVVLLFPKVGLAAESTQHFKMLSTVEYTGRYQFKNQVESLFTAKKQTLSDDKVQYFISAKDFYLAGGNKEISFVVDTKSRQLSQCGRDLVLLERVNNQCSKSLQKVSKDNIGKTWKQSFVLSSLGNPFPKKLRFTVTAVQLKTKVFGEMIAVRALSEPFIVNVAKRGGGRGVINCRVNAVYLFDMEIEDIYVSISAFWAATNMSGFSEKLHHEVATYMTSASGVAVDLRGLSKKFEKLVKKVGLTGKSLKIKKKGPLPQWAGTVGLAIGQMSNVCAAVACEGALNPVIAVCIPVAKTFAMQSAGTLASVGGLAAAGTLTLGSVSGSLAGGVPAISAMNLAGGATIMGVGAGTAAVVGGGTVGGIAAGGGFDSGGSSHTPASP